MKKFFSYLLALPVMLAMLVSVGCKDSDPEQEPSAPQLTLSVKSKTDVSAVIAAEVKSADNVKYTYYLKGQRPEESKIEWKTLAVKADGTYDIPVDGLTTATEYTFEALAAFQTTASAKKTIDFTTASAPAAVTVENQVAGNNMISFKATYGSDCEAFFYALTPKADYKEEQFLADCKPVGEGWVTNALGQKSGVVYQNMNGVIPKANTEYVLAVVGAKLKPGTVFWNEFVGGVATFEIKTPELGVNVVDKTVSIVPDLSRLTFGGVPVTISRADSEIAGFYNGMVKKSDLGTKNINTYVSEWLAAEMVGGFGGVKNYEMPTIFENEQNSREIDLVLEQNTEYVLFALAYDQSGKFGKVMAAEVKTPGVEFNSDAVVDMVIVPDITTTNIALKFKNNCENAFYIHEIKGTSTLEAATDRLLRNFASNMDYWTSNMKEAKFEFLQPDTEYDLFVLPVDAEGKFGQVISTDYSTEPIEFNSAARVAVTVTDITFNETNLTYDHTFSLTYSGGATGCEFVTVWVEDGNTETARELATRMYTNSAEFIKTVKTNFPRGFQESEVGCKVVFIPLDIEGQRGEPTMITVAAPAQ